MKPNSTIVVFLWSLIISISVYNCLCYELSAKVDFIEETGAIDNDINSEDEDNCNFNKEHIICSINFNCVNYLSTSIYYKPIQSELNNGYGLKIIKPPVY